MVADPAKANEQAAPIAPKVARANTIFASNPSVVCGEAMIAVSRQKGPGLFSACGKTGGTGLSSLPPWHSCPKLVNLIQSSRDPGGSTMRNFGLVLALCGAAALNGTSSIANAFETQESGDPIDGKLLLAPQSVAQDIK